MIEKRFLCVLTTLLMLSIYSVASKTSDYQESRSGEFAVKGFHLDLRIQVMTPQALKAFAREIADLGLNTLVVEWEATYPFVKHATISNQYSYSREEVTDFINYCKELGLNVIPLQQSLGHVEYILRNPRYSHLKEDRKDISQICPLKTEESKELFRDLFEDLIQTHDSDFIHIGGDETYLLGHCEKCQKRVKEVGKSKLFVDHMKMITQLVIDMGKTPLMWADIILKYPEAASELPSETVFIDWNYGWKINHFGNISDLQKLGFSFWGAPSIRSHPDNWFITDWPTHFNNQRDFIPYARNENYEGIIMTSWSTTGLYGFTWDVGFDVIDMVQIRNTYPMSGFKILIHSYAESLKKQDPIDPQEFVLRYAKNQFGLTNQEAEYLWGFFSFPPELIVNGRPEKSADVAEMKKKFEPIRDRINNSNPKLNKEEFEHFKLMSDLRMHYLNYKEIEEKYNSDDFSESMVPELLQSLELVFEEAKLLDKRFFELNRGFLYDSEIEHQNSLRIQQAQVLYSRLSKLK